MHKHEHEVICVLCYIRRLIFRSKKKQKSCCDMWQRNDVSWMVEQRSLVCLWTQSRKAQLSGLKYSQDGEIKLYLRRICVYTCMSWVKYGWLTTIMIHDMRILSVCCNILHYFKGILKNYKNKINDYWRSSGNLAKKKNRTNREKRLI
jgi:hypothetical protein